VLEKILRPFDQALHSQIFGHFQILGSATKRNDIVGREFHFDSVAELGGELECPCPTREILQTNLAGILVLLGSLLH